MNLQAERLNRGLSVTDMADAVGVPEWVVRYAEKGNRPHPRNALKFAQFFDVKVTDIWPLDREEAA